MLKLKKCKKNGGFTFFIPGAKMYPVMMLIQIHARGSGIFFIKTVQYGAFLNVPKYVKINFKSQQFSRLILHNSKDYLPYHYQSSIPTQKRMLARK